MATMSWKRFQRLLFAARGGNVASFPRSGLTDNHKRVRRGLLRVFPLQAKHVRLDAITGFQPCNFHRKLCQRIRSATKRIHFASLYIGPGADPGASPHEVELLNALQTTSCPDVRILLDRNRALRPVPLSATGPINTLPKKGYITSAEACHQALTSNSRRRSHSIDGNRSVFLLSVLPDWLQAALPNPWNEVAGVFHLKIYILDDEVIVSGANLSQEYFDNRIDRYLWVQHGGNGLVDCLDEMLQVLMRYAVPYDSTTTNTSCSSLQQQQYHGQISTKELMESITRVLTTSPDEEKDALDMLQLQNDPDIVAYAIPTFQAPAHFFHSSSTLAADQRQLLPTDEQVLEDLLREAAHIATSQSHQHERRQQESCAIRLAAAYLNPTLTLQTILQHGNFSQIHFLTAGHISHGFKQKKNKTECRSASSSSSSSSSSMKTEWIPAVFDTLARLTMSRVSSSVGSKNSHGRTANLWFYQRSGWTFHAKGLWLTMKEKVVTPSTRDDDNNNSAPDKHIINELKTSLFLDSKPSSSPSPCSLLAVTHGSSNYGARSAVRDMESNILLLFPPSDGNRRASPLQEAFCEEWNQLCKYASPDEPNQKLPLPLRMILPWIQSFF